MSCDSQCSVVYPHYVLVWAVPCVIVVFPDYTNLLLMKSMIVYSISYKSQRNKMVWFGSFTAVLRASHNAL